MQWRYCHEILGCGYEPNQGDVEEPSPPPDQKAWGGQEKRARLLVGDLSLKEQEFLELSLERYFVNIGCYPFTDV